MPPPVALYYLKIQLYFYVLKLIIIIKYALNDVFFGLIFVDIVDNFNRGTIVVRVIFGRSDLGRTKNGDKVYISIRMGLQDGTESWE